MNFINIKMYIGIVISLVNPCSSMFGYDCAGKDLNITSISLLDTEPCPDYKTTSVIDSLEIQVLQLRETYNIKIYQCMIELDYHVTHCGMHSHASEVKNGWGTLVQSLTQDECRSIHKDQVANVFGQKITGIKRNHTLITSIVLAGWANDDGYCEGGALALGNFNWKDVYATAKVKITISDSTGIYRVGDDKIITKRGLTCSYSSGSYRFITWDFNIGDDCSRTSHIVLYQGRASKIIVKSLRSDFDHYTLYSIKDKQFLATLTQSHEKSVCGFSLYTTDHPKLLVQELRDNIPYFVKSEITPNNMDIFLYVNAKFTHVENHVRQEMTKMYETIVKEQCESKREVLKTQLSLAVIDPVEFAYMYMKSPGYTGVVMGEQIHVVKCNPVFVSSRRVEECYNELPVNFSGKPMFMSPRSHILQKTGTPVACSMLMQPSFLISGTWYTSSNGLSKTSDPSILSPVSGTQWTYTDAGSLAIEGIYSFEDLDKLRSQLMYPSERKAITQTVSSAINQDAYISDTSLFRHLITKENVENTFKDFMNNTWSGFLTFGNLFSGIFGILLICRIIKWSFDTLIHSRGLYEVYGCGWQILGSFWDAVTTYLLSPVKVARYNKNKESKEEEKASLPLNDVTTTEPTIYPSLSRIDQDNFKSQLEKCDQNLEPSVPSKMAVELSKLFNTRS